ncbi:hypothetical protein L3556_09435 [Candidatus Synechococcus calcipolaris G9]|uniref:Restriction endonuclease n=1 Tax=Candidatus Synechococcus calcipolaris G9 TaxID=1497997 RepID=A0ABT6EZZ9_9SYNE|nr:hypothetical protein [Candidatus Synechococcus calcipolaris]MDG2991147.1 hypothetical protein [Candidatus Synechococcus calcipolaris G9]
MAQSSRIPIMSLDEEQFMAFEGLVQWTRAVVLQAQRVTAAKKKLDIEEIMRPFKKRIEAIHNSHSEDHFFVIAAHKLIEYRKWVEELGLCTRVDFSKIDSFDKVKIIDLRNMREHVIDYFKGEGRAKDRWVEQTPDYSADASSVVGTMIGGRLDYLAFAIAAEHLLSQLLVEPIPYSNHSLCAVND